MGIAKKIVHWCSALIGSLAFVMSSVSPVMAATPVYGDYDPGKTGSITLYKYVSNDGKSLSSTGAPLANTSNGQLSAVQNATGNYRMLPEKGVSFKYLKIADYVQISNSSGSGMYITDLDNGFLNLLQRYGIALNSSKNTANTDNGVEDSKKHYNSDDVVSAMGDLTKATDASDTGEEAIRKYIATTGTAFNEKTNMYGKTTAENLSLGLYLVAEVDWEHQSLSKSDNNAYWERNEDGTEDRGNGSNYADIVSPSSPFLVQIPMQNVVEMSSGGKTYAPGTGWLYDITAYPKNGTMTVHKDIIVDNHSDKHTHNDGNDTNDVETLCDYEQINYLNNNTSGEYDDVLDDNTQLDSKNTHSTLTHQIDVNIGDTVYQVISSDVPALVGDKVNKTYKISDTMLEGLSFLKLDDVKLGTGTWDSETNQTLVKDTDYILNVSDDKKSFTVELTDVGLAKLNSVDTASYLYVTFESNMNKDALIGTTTAGDDKHTNQNTAKLTYATDRTAEHDYYSNTCKVYTYELDITKNVTKTNKGGNLTDVAFKIEGSKRDTTNGINNNINAQDKDYETLQFIKEDEGVYKVYDPVSNDGAEITDTVNPDTNGNLRILGVDARDYKITEVKTSENHSLLAEPFYVRLSANMSGKRKFETGALSHAYFWSGNEPLKITKYDIRNSKNGNDLDNGVAKIAVLNNTAFSMLRTGGNGTLYIKAIGIGLIAGGLIYLIVRKKKEKEGTDDRKE